MKLNQVKLINQPYNQVQLLQDFLDQNILVVNNESGVLTEDVFDKIKTEFSSAKFIHRLDRNTSGLIVAAKTLEASKQLLELFKDKELLKCIGKAPRSEAEWRFSYAPTRPWYENIKRILLRKRLKSCKP